MTTLAKNTPRDYQLGDYEDQPVVADDIIYEGAAVGDNASGYARPLVAGDPFMGFAAAKADNTGGSAGDIRARLKTKGRIKLAVGSLAITDVGKDVFASDDDTFTLTQSTNTRIGHVTRFISTGVGIVEFSSTQSQLAELTDNSSGAASDTLASITSTEPANLAAVGTQLGIIKNAIASLAAKNNALTRRLGA
jgi:hypothetical protein